MHDFNSVYIEILNKIVTSGHLVKANPSLSIGSQRDYFEVLNYQFSIDRPHLRLVHPDYKTFNIYRAIGRFLWLMRGSNSLHEIAYYDSNVFKFSDDGIVIPGSSFGNRIFNSGGINQFKNVIRILEEDNSSRRAAISIFQPFDNERTSKDIPCLFGIFFHIRNNQLHTSIIVRSNNALRILPYNFFELSLFAEILALELKINTGPIHYHAISMHLYYDDLAFYKENISKLNFQKYSQSNYENPTQNSSLLESLPLLQKIETKIRLSNPDSFLKDLQSDLELNKTLLPLKWFQFYLLLCDYYILQNNLTFERSTLIHHIIKPYKDYLWE